MGCKEKYENGREKKYNVVIMLGKFGAVCSLLDSIFLSFIGVLVKIRHRNK